MSTGIRYADQDEAGILSTDFPCTALNLYADDTASYEYTNLRKLALGLPASKEPVAAAFKYNPYHPILMGLILERTTGRSVSAYLPEEIWQPLGTGFPATWSLDSTKHGFEKMESGLNGRAIDFAKAGRVSLGSGAVDSVTRLGDHLATAPGAIVHSRVGEANAGFASPAGHSLAIAMRLGSAFAASLIGVRTSRMPSRYDAATFS